jgi:hypothetical protein
MNFSCPEKMACCSASVSADRTSGLMFRTTRYFTGVSFDCGPGRALSVMSTEPTAPP